MQGIKVRMFAGFMICASTFVVSVSAQEIIEGDSSTTSDIEVIDVIGSRLNLATGAPAGFLEIPFSTSSVDTEDMLRQGGTTLLDGLRSVPGVQADMSFVGSHSQTFIVRGSIADNGTQSSRILRDGARLSNYAFTPAFIDTINVLRGPGATASARSEPGGTVDVTSKSAELANFGRAYLRVGEQNSEEYWLDVNRILSDKHGFAGRFIAMHSAASEWRSTEDKLSGIKLNLSKSDGNLYHLAFDFEATDHIYQPDFGIPALGSRPADVPLDRQLSEPFDDSETNNRIYTLSGDFQLNATTQWYLDYTHLDGKSISIRNSLFREISGPPGTFMRVTAYEPHGKREIDSFASNLVSVFDAGIHTHHIFVGAEYYQEQLSLPRLRVPPVHNPSINVYNPVFGLTTAPTGSLAESLTEQDSETMILSLQDRVEVGRFNVLLGLQFVSDDSYYGEPGTMPAVEDRFSPKAGITYALTENQTIYTSYTTGTSPQYVATATNESVPMRLSEQVEAGWKGVFGNHDLVTEFSIYRIKQDRTITPDDTLFGRFSVNGEAQSTGFEASAHGNLTQRISIGFSYAYTDAEFLEGSLNPGSRTPNVPYNSGNIFADFNWKDNWYTSLNLYAQGARYADLANTATLPGYMSVDLSQGYQMDINGKPLEIRLNIRNLMDKEYYSGSHLHVSRYIMPAEGRNISASIMYHL